MRLITKEHIPVLCDAIGSTGCENLLVGGASFTTTNPSGLNSYMKDLQELYNNVRGDTDWPELKTGQDWQDLPNKIKKEIEDNGINWRELSYLTWPVYTRDFLAFKNIYDCSWPAAGNQHIHDSVMYALETNPNLTPKNTFVAIMWTHYDRDDFIVDSDWVDPYWLNSVGQYRYDKNVSLGLTGGSAYGATNLLCSIKNVKKIKSSASRAIENYLCVVGLAQYLKARGFRYIFSLTESSYWTGNESDPQEHLPAQISNKWKSLFTEMTPLGVYAQETWDKHHPLPKWHRLWSQDVLIPEILKLIQKGTV